MYLWLSVEEKYSLDSVNILTSTVHAPPDLPDYRRPGKIFPRGFPRYIRLKVHLPARGSISPTYFKFISDLSSLAQNR